MLCYRKTIKIVSNRTNVFSDSVIQSQTCFSYVNDITSFIYNAIHNVFRNTGKCFSHINRSFRTLYVHCRAIGYKYAGIAMSAFTRKSASVRKHIYIYIYTYICI